MANEPSRPELKANPIYKQQGAYWKFFLDSYEGGWRLLTKDYLFSHSREADTDFQNRLKRATPTGYARTVINSYKSLLSRAPVVRDMADPALIAFMDEDADGMGTGLSQLIYERIFPINQACGTAWVLVDMPNPQDAPVSLADEQEIGMEPYCVVYPPTQILNWKFDGFGRLEFVTVALPIEATSSSITYTSQKYNLKLWTDTEWILYTARGEELSRGTHGAGKVPFVVSYNERSLIDPFQGVSAINNIAYINREVFNLWSLLQDFMYRQCFNLLALPESLLADVDEDTGKRTLEVGTANAIPIPPGDFSGQYLTPPTDPAKFLLETIERDVERIYDEAKLKGGGAAQVATGQSGISKAFDFHETNMLMAKKAQNLEDTERGIVELWGAHKGMSDLDYNVSYARTFDLRDATEELDELTTFLGLPVPVIEAKRERLRKAMQALFADAKKEVKERIDAEVDTVPISGTTGGAPGPAVQSLAQRLNLGRAA